MKPESTIAVSLVEDDVRVRNLMGRWIGEEPRMRVVSQYPDAESAIAGMPADRPDVVLLDINLGRLSGIDCVRHLKPPAAGHPIRHGDGL
ncbi:MAG: response regulator [Lacunisphaera sp.]